VVILQHKPASDALLGRTDRPDLHCWVQGVLEEVRLIKWPTPQGALLNTLLVIAIVAGTSALLFGLNALLAELSAAVYTKS